jgi:phosphate starvation-inducible PhoH-like protein
MTQKKSPPKREVKKQSKVVEHSLTASKIESISTKNSDNFKLELTDIQKPIVNLHRQNDIMILTGSPGTGKDFMQIYRAISGLISKEFEEVIFMRTILEATSSKLGFLKGDEDSKLQPYLEVFQEHVKSMVKPHTYERIKNKIRFEYPGFIRGKTFGGNDKGNVCVVLTEAQNCELKELVTISTRMAEGSKLYLNGDFFQSDIGSKSGLKAFIGIVKNIEGIGYEELDDTFQMRGRLVQEIDTAYRKYLNSINK